MTSNNFITAYGTLKYSTDPYKLIVEIDPEIARLYRALVSKTEVINKPKYPPHISVVRKEVPTNLENWAAYQDNEVEFIYECKIYEDETYYWLNVQSKQLEAIRAELGLTTTSPLTRSPDGTHLFHSTIGNKKNIQR